MNCKTDEPMLTKLTIRNFKRLGNVELELGEVVVFIGPNNSGKTAALQALALWDVGVKRWIEKRGIDQQIPKKRPGVTINRKDLISIPVPRANLLWKDLHVRDVQRENGKQHTSNVLIEIIVEGVTNDKQWQCGMEFDYANEESIYCRPLRIEEGAEPRRMPVPEAVKQLQIAYLPPMSGLAANETRLDPGAVNVRIGEGRTAEVLRNLCYKIYEENQENWSKLTKYIHDLFSVELKAPEYVVERGEIQMAYRDRNDIKLDLSSSGRGLQQVLLLLAYQYANPGAVLLLDEPDAHLEILRQREIYQLITEIANHQNGQIIAASHSEIILNEAADRDIVIAFVGKPHRIDDRGSQLLKSLKAIGYEQYYQAEQTGWVLYLEGSTDLAILQKLAKKLDHPAADILQERPFVHYVQNQPQKARDHFFGLREAHDKLVGIALFDQIDRNLHQDGPLKVIMWRRREIENYICQPNVLLALAEAQVQEDSPGPLFSSSEAQRRCEVMWKWIERLVPRVALDDPNDPYWHKTKVTDDFLDRLFEEYYKELELPNLMRKTDYHRLAEFISPNDIDPEVKEKLDAIVKVANEAKPLQD